MPPRSGERRLQILQTLAEMLEAPNPERITIRAGGPWSVAMCRATVPSRRSTLIT